MTCELCITETVRAKYVLARKDHTCCECQKVIQKGSRYYYFEACWPELGGWRSFKTCLRCKRVRDLAEDKYPVYDESEVAAFGELYDWVREARR